MTDLGSERIRDKVLLIARILFTVLFLVFGWVKLTDYSWTVAYMTRVALLCHPSPRLWQS